MEGTEAFEVLAGLRRAVGVRRDGRRVAAGQSASRADATGVERLSISVLRSRRRAAVPARLHRRRCDDGTVMTRTFSKIHGLAAMRLGWCYAPAAIADVMNRIRGPFNVNGPAMAAGIASLQDEAHMAKALAHNDQWLPWLTKEIEALGLNVTPSVGNFLLIHFPHRKGQTALEADAFLTERGLILRSVSAYGLPDCLRLTIGSEEANRLVVSALKEFMARA